MSVCRACGKVLPDDSRPHLFCDWRCLEGWAPEEEESKEEKKRILHELTSSMPTFSASDILDLLQLTAPVKVELKLVKKSSEKDSSCAPVISSATPIKIQLAPTKKIADKDPIFGLQFDMPMHWPKSKNPISDE